VPGSGVFDERQGHDAPQLSGKAIAAILVLAAFTILIIWRAHLLELTLEGESEQPQLVDKPAPNFSATTLDGRTVSLADFHGQKNIVVAFWASWCAPCRLEMPALAKFYKRHHTDSSDFEILAVSIDREPKDAEEYAAGQKLGFPVLLDSHEKMADDYAVYSIPTMFVVDKNGKIIYGHSGYNATMEYRLASELGIKDDPHGGAE
jgi:peroxiredoxin